MERLLALIGLTYLSVLAVVFYLDEKLTVLLCGVLLLFSILFLLFKKYRKTIYLPVVAFVAVIACVVNISYTTFVYDKTVEKYDNTSANITAVLIEEPYKYYNKYYYEFECKTVNSQKADFKFIASHRDLFNIDIFDEIEADVDFYKTTRKDTISNAYFITADFSYEYPQLNVTTEKSKPMYYYAVKLRQTIRGFLKNNLSVDAYPLCSALFLGDKYLLTNEIKEDFTHAGVSHIIVVSGMHFSIIFGFVLVLAHKYYRYRYYIILPSMFLALVYMALTGFTPSVFRSGVMMLFCVFSFLISREPYSLNSLGLAGILITLINGPYIASNIGLILSFSTTFSIIILHPKLYEKFSKRIIDTKFSKLLTGMFRAKRKSKSARRIIKVLNSIPSLFLSMLCVNIAAYIAALPLAIFFFHSAPTLSIISGFLLYFPIEALLFLILVMVLTAFLPFVTDIFAFLIDLISACTLSIVDFFASIPFSYIDVTYKYVCIWVLSYVVLLSLLWLCKGKHKFSLFTILVTILFLVGYISSSVFSSYVCDLYVYEVNDGISVLYSSKEISAVLNFECSGFERNASISKLENTVNNLDFAAAVNNSTNSNNSMKSLCQAFAIDTVLMYDTKRTADIPLSINEFYEPQDSQTVNFSDGSKAEYIFTDEKYFVYFTYFGKSLLIVPKGDNIENIEEKYRSADTIILSDCPENFELLCCDTLIINADKSYAYNLMKLTHGICNRVLLTCEGDIKLVTEV